MELEQIYEQLVEQGLCKSGLQFSTEYLGRYKSYYSVIKATKAKPSINVLVNLDFSLQRRLDNIKSVNSSRNTDQQNILIKAQTTIKKWIINTVKNDRLKNNYMSP